MRASHYLAVCALVPAVFACSASDKGSTRELVDILGSPTNPELAVFVWRDQSSSTSKTKILFGLGNTQQRLNEIGAFGSADFSVSTVKYGWSTERTFSVCAAKTDLLKIENPLEFASVIDSTEFTNHAQPCDGDAFYPFPPSIEQA